MTIAKFFESDCFTGSVMSQLVVHSQMKYSDYENRECNIDAPDKTPNGKILMFEFDNEMFYVADWTYRGI